MNEQTQSYLWFEILRNAVQWWRFMLNDIALCFVRWYGLRVNGHHFVYSECPRSPRHFEYNGLGVRGWVVEWLGIGSELCNGLPNGHQFNAVFVYNPGHRTGYVHRGKVIVRPMVGIVWSRGICIYGRWPSKHAVDGFRYIYWICSLSGCRFGSSVGVGAIGAARICGWYFCLFLTWIYKANNGCFVYALCGRTEQNIYRISQNECYCAVSQVYRYPYMDSIDVLTQYPRR